MPILTRRTLLQSLSAAGLAALLPGARGQTSAPALPFTERTFNADPNDPLTPTLSKVHVGIRKLADNLYTLLGDGGSVSVFDGPDGAIVIDSGLPDRAKDVATALAAVAKYPPGTLINTHWHFDHTGGNAALRAAGYRILAHTNTRKHLSEKVTVEFLNMTAEPSPEPARPATTFDDRLTLHVNGDTLHLVHVPPAHTDSDIYVLFENAGVLQTGDIFFNGYYPFIDYSTGGSLDGMIGAEEKLVAALKDFKIGNLKIVPGHGPVGTPADLQASLDMLKKTRDVLKPLIDAKKSLEEITAAKPLAVFNGKFSQGFLDDDTFVKLVYMCYTHKA